VGGKLTVVLHRSNNRKGEFHMGASNFPASVDLEKAVFFVYPQSDGSLLLSIEKFEPKEKQGRKRA